MLNYEENSDFVIIILKRWDLLLQITFLMNTYCESGF